MRLIPLCLLGAALLCCGCNAVYFYETDKVSLSVEVRPDATGPIQGNFGLKQRVVALVPKRNGNPTKVIASPEARRAAMKEIKAAMPDTATLDQAAAGNQQAALTVRQQLAQMNDAASNSDAMAVLSSLRFHKLPKPDGAPFWKISHMTIDSALITGEAAKLVARPGHAIGALSGTKSTAPAPKKLTALHGLYGVLKGESATDPTARKLVDRLDALASDLPTTYPFTRYANGAVPDAEIHKGKPVQNRSTFQHVLSYWGDLQNTEENLKAFLADGNSEGANANSSRQDLQNDLANATRLREQLEATTLSTPVVREAATYFVSGL